MIEQLIAIVDFIIAAFLHTWPYLVITIPLSVAVQMSGAARHINRAFKARPIIAILLATLVGAFSPFCSCGVVPLITALLIGGVPLAPVMSFWIASPSMDPEVFFLSVATIGWELAVWRLLATCAVSLAAGFITHFVVQRGWLGDELLRLQPTAQPQWRERLRRVLRPQAWHNVKERLAALLSPKLVLVGVTPAAEGSSSMPAEGLETVACSSCAAQTVTMPEPADDCGCETPPAPFWKRLLGETWKATLMVVKFMALAFFLEALIELYIPEQWITGLLGSDKPYAILAAAFLGVPAYASNLTALSLIGGLLAQGMNPAAALAFLISGPTTTLPAMAAVWGISSRRVFALYVSFSLVGAIVTGYAYALAAGF